MTISTRMTPADRKERTSELRKHHESTFAAYGIEDAVFIAKMCYTPAGKNELYVTVFPSEFNKQQDLYFEFTSKDLTPETIDRKLYKLRYNPHYHEEYEVINAENPGTLRYLVPVHELIYMDPNKAPKEEENSMTFDLPDANTDLPINQMTIRDFAAIMLKKPVSDKKWLNEIILTK